MIPRGEYWFYRESDVDYDMEGKWKVSGLRGVGRRKKSGRPGEEKRDMKERLPYRRLLKAILIISVQLWRLIRNYNGSYRNDAINPSCNNYSVWVG